MRLRRGKSRPRGSHAERHLGDRGAAVGDDLLEQRLVVARVDALVAAGEDGDRAGGERRPMGARVDAARQARDDDIAGRAEIAREPLGEGEARRGGVARADDRHRRAGAEPRPSRARRASGGAVSIACSGARIVRLAERDEADRRDATLASISRLGLRAGGELAGPAAPAGEARQRLEAPRGAAERLTRARKVRGPMPRCGSGAASRAAARR